MRIIKKVAGIVSATVLLAVSSTAVMAQDIPCKTAKLIVPWNPGGGTHIIFSIFEETINAMDGPKIQVVTVPGQAGNKGAKEAKNATADGCTLFAIHQSAIVGYLAGRVDFTWDAFDMVARVTSTPELVGGSGSAPWADFNEVIAAAKADPGTINLGATIGSTTQFMWLLIEDKNPGAKFNLVPFDGTKERVTALLADTIQLGSINIPTAEKYVAEGELKAYAVAADERLAQFPDLPTLKELGTDMSYGLDRGIVAPKGTPPAVLEMWGQMFKAAAESPELIEKLQNMNTPVSWVGPEEYTQWFEAEYAAHETVAIEVGMFKK